MSKEDNGMIAVSSEAELTIYPEDTTQISIVDAVKLFIKFEEFDLTLSKEDLNVVFYEVLIPRIMLLFDMSDNYMTYDSKSRNNAKKDAFILRQIFDKIDKKILKSKKHQDKFKLKLTIDQAVLFSEALERSQPEHEKDQAIVFRILENIAPKL